MPSHEASSLPAKPLAQEIRSQAQSAPDHEVGQAEERLHRLGLELTLGDRNPGARPRLGAGPQRGR